MTYICTVKRIPWNANMQHTSVIRKPMVTYSSETFRYRKP